MGHVIVKLEIVVDNGMVGMVELDEMLQTSGAFLLACLNIVYFHGFEVDGRAGIAS